MMSAVRLEVSKPLIFSSALFSLFSFALWPAVASAIAWPKIPLVPDCDLFAFLAPNIDEVDCDIIGNKGFESLDLTSNDGLGNAPNVRGVAALSLVVSLPLAPPKLLLEETSVEPEDARLLKLPKGKLLEDGCLMAPPRLKRLLELEVLARDAFMDVKAAFLLKTVPKTGVEAWDGARNEVVCEPVAKMLEDTVVTETSALDSLFPNPELKMLFVDGTTAVVTSPEK